VSKGPTDSLLGYIAVPIGPQTRENLESHKETQKTSLKDVLCTPYSILCSTKCNSCGYCLSGGISKQKCPLRGRIRQLVNMINMYSVGTVYPANRLGSAIETQDNANHTNIISPDYASCREIAHTEYNGNAFQLFARCRQIPGRITSMMTIL
jgi:hypothetical protein